MLHQWMLFLVGVNILASPVTQITDNQQPDELLWNPISNNVIASADTDIANCVTDSLDTPDKSSENIQNENILRRESRSCPNSQGRTIPMPPGKQKHRTLPEPQTTQAQEQLEQLEKHIQTLCPYEQFPFLLYCSGPEVPGYATFKSYFLYLLTMNCLNG